VVEAADTPSGEPVDLRDLGEQALIRFVEGEGEPGYRGAQMFRWIHQRGARSLDEMSDLPRAFRARLEGRVTMPALEIARVERSRDGTRKYALRTARGDIVESVFIPDASAPGRNTLCISSQVGCAIDCKFCLTASLGLLRNLGPGEIVEQITRVKEDLGPDGPPILNVVMMGMGEPLQNYRNVVASLGIMMSEGGHNLSGRRITVSTAGIAPKIPRLGRDAPVNLAVSLNATTDEVRSRLMPINDRWNIDALLAACRTFPLPKRRRITFEYVLLSGVNDTDDDARRLVRLLRPLRSKVNLIPFNEHPYSPFSRPSPDRIARFREIVGGAGITTMVRTPRGDDISAACGQLGLEVEAPKSNGKLALYRG
jgi:23S rRNA (adenine2503-C2)-methyltransferase